MRTSLYSQGCFSMKIVVKPLGSLVLVAAIFGLCVVGGMLLRNGFAADKEGVVPVVGTAAALSQKPVDGKVTLKCPDCGATFTTSVPELADLVLPDALRGDPNIRSYPAEDATVKNAVVKITGSLPGYLGGGFVEFPNKSGDSVEFDVTAPMEGNYMVAFRYANPSPEGQIMRIVKRSGDNAEEVLASELAFPRTTRQRNWDYISLQAHLTVGKNAIRIESVKNGGPALDGLVIVPVQSTTKK